MRGLLARSFVAMLLGAVLVPVASAAQSGDTERRDFVEAILSRALIERAALSACAALADDGPTATVLARGWQLDLEEAAGVLHAAGFSDDYVRSIATRFDLQKATPTFGDRAALAAYCAMLGDWKRRWANLLVVVPQIELRRGLAQ